MARVVVSESEILEELRSARKLAAAPDPPGAFVVSELAKKTRQSERTIRMQLELLRKKGQVEVLRVFREGSDGRQLMVTAYRIIKADGKK